MTAERGSLRARAIRQVSALTTARLAELAPVNAYTLPAARLLVEHVLRAAAPPLRGTTAVWVTEQQTATGHGIKAATMAVPRASARRSAEHRTVVLAEHVATGVAVPADRAAAVQATVVTERAPAPETAKPSATAETMAERSTAATALTEHRATDEAVSEHGIRGEWVRGPGAVRTDAVILYIHGGGFVTGSVLGYRGVASRLSAATGLAVFTLDYRLAPEHPFPAAPVDVATAFRWLAARFGPDRVVVAGDSAGGFLAAHLAVENARAGLAPPAALVLFSPMTDLSLGLAVGHRHADRDGLLSTRLARRAIAHVTDAPFDLRPEPGMRLPPSLIHASDSEYFGADAEELARRWRATGARCALRMWPDQLHAFPTLPVLVPEARAAYRAAARFVATQLGTAPAVITQKVVAS